MEPELQDKLFKDFPLLYGDRTKPMTQTAMCWGIDTGDGWYDLIRQLSVELEPHIQKILDENPNLSCGWCSCEKDRHIGCRTDNPGKCLAIIKSPTKWRWFREPSMSSTNFIVKRFQKIRIWIAGLANRFMRRASYRLTRCHCEKYDAHIPRASQVKEKFGGLRFYMTMATDEMFDFIEEAESKSTTICEVCGEPGKTFNDGWMVTLCENHKDSPRDAD